MIDLVASALYAGIASPPTLFQQISLNPPSSCGEVVPQEFVGIVNGNAVVAVPSALFATATVFVHEFRR